MSLLKPTRGIQLSKSHLLARGLVGFWPFSDGTGKTVFDLSLSGNLGTFVGLPTWAAGKFGSALSWNGGSGNYVDCGEIFPVSSDYTIVAWVKRGVGGGVAGDNILSGTGGHAFWVVDNKLSTGHTEYTEVQDPDTFTEDVWHQVAVTFANTGTVLVLYKDGIEVDRKAAAGENSNVFCRIGVFSTGNAWEGLIDHVILYNRFLSSLEIALLKINPFCMFEPSLNIARISSVVVSGVVEIAGSLAALSVLTDVAPLKRARVIAGGVTAQSFLTDSAVLKRARVIAGGVTAQSSLSGSVKVSRKISGAIAATSSLSGVLSLVGEVSRSRGSGFKPIEGAERLRGLRRSAFY